MIKDHPDMTEQFAKIFNETFLLQTNSILGTLARPIVDKYEISSGKWIQTHFCEHASKPLEIRHFARVACFFNALNDSRYRQDRPERRCSCWGGCTY